MEEPIAISLDPDAIVTLWSKWIMKPADKEKVINASSLEGWRWCGRVDLSMAIHSWKWSEENLGKTFPSSIWIVSEVLVFPDGFDVAQDWLVSILDRD